MNRAPDQERLLADVLAEGAPPDFRAALLGETLQLARRRRQFRRAQQVGAVAAVVSALGFFAWRSAPSPAAYPALPATRPAIAANYELVRTHALPAAQQIATRTFAAEHIVASFASIATVRTPAEDGIVRLIDDNELLALAPQPAALVRVGPNDQELVIVDQTDQDNSR